ncbi:glycosyltransferase family 2 protein [Hyphomicrobium sp. 99]|uniref:glycosyltransferase family 2 protein n=1 Tax=Hyphomicrobium sp. 99 TaxID=1163419 RepID=UPI0005F810F5|nr:glycosyltransferase family 2 protein [Hyphomicrobium sp. 99]
MAPLVSLALPVYNGEKFLAEAGRSILSQEFSDFELIITDNASTDRTQEICEELAASDKRVRYFRNERNLGASENFNLGFRLSTGKYFKWCAHDDYISPTFVGSCASALDADPDAVLAYGETQCIDGQGKLIPLVGTMMPSIVDTDPVRRFATVVTGQFTCFEMFGVFRSEALRASTMHRSYYGSDRALLAEMALMGKFIRVRDAVLYNREHASRSIHIDKKARGAWQNTSADRWAGMEHWLLIRHLTAIALRHRRTVSPVKTLYRLMVWAMTPMQLARYSLELIGAVAPSAYAPLRRGSWQAVSAVRRSFGGQDHQV